jgi:hypothetical protein
VEVSVVDGAPPVGYPTDTGTAFFAGTTTKGALGAQRVYSYSDAVSKYGTLQENNTLLDSVAAYFSEGGYMLYLSRVVGPGAVAASLALPAASDAGVSIAAAGPGSYGNGLQAEVIVTGTAPNQTTTVNVYDASGLITSSGPVTAKSDLLTWGQYDNTIDITDLATSSTALPKALTKASLAGGADDASNITLTQWQTALTAFGPELGPGQVAAPGQPTVAQALADHALANNRFALCDGADGANASALTTIVSTIRSTDAKAARYAAIFAPWANCVLYPGVAARAIPWSAIEAGMIGRNENIGNQPAAGNNGVSRVAASIRTPTNLGDTRDTLMAAGVNTVRAVNGVVMAYGWRTMSSEAAWVSIQAPRVVMKVYAVCEAVAENHLFRIMDGQGIEIAHFAGDITGAMMAFYNQGLIYGQNPQDSFQVDVGPSVNTPATLANNELHAVVYIRVSPYSELVSIEIVKVATDQALAVAA